MADRSVESSGQISAFVEMVRQEVEREAGQRVQLDGELLTEGEDQDKEQEKAR